MKVYSECRNLYGLNVSVFATDTHVLSIRLEECENDPNDNTAAVFDAFELGTLSVPLDVSGTLFQKAVWKGISTIPFGETITYGELAERIGFPLAVRAVANACGANRFPLLIPCHRVVAKNGIGGFAYGVDVKRKLLSYEASSIASPEPAACRPS